MINPCTIPESMLPYNGQTPNLFTLFFSGDTMKTRILKADKRFILPLIGLALLGTCTGLTGMTGCKMVKKRIHPIDTDAHLEDAPPIRTTILNDHHMLVMQAPNPGWSFSIDKDEQLKDSTRLSITIYRPDPTFSYPQMIVKKNLLTDIRSHRDLEIYARVLNKDDKPERYGYQPLETVDQFDD